MLKRERTITVEITEMADMPDIFNNKPFLNLSVLNLIFIGGDLRNNLFFILVNNKNIIFLTSYFNNNKNLSEFA